MIISWSKPKYSFKRSDNYFRLEILILVRFIFNHSYWKMVGGCRSVFFLCREKDFIINLPHFGSHPELQQFSIPIKLCQCSFGRFMLFLFLLKIRILYIYRYISYFLCLLHIWVRVEYKVIFRCDWFYWLSQIFYWLFFKLVLLIFPIHW